MNLYDQATADLATMINDREFARPVSINGAAAVACILDDELAKVGADGLREWDATLYVRAADFEPEPVIDQRLELAGEAPLGTRSAIVVHVDTQHGLRTIRLRWFES